MDKDGTREVLTEDEVQTLIEAATRGSDGADAYAISWFLQRAQEAKNDFSEEPAEDNGRFDARILKAILSGSIVPVLSVAETFTQTPSRPRSTSRADGPSVRRRSRQRRRGRMANAEAQAPPLHRPPVNAPRLLRLTDSSKRSGVVVRVLLKIVGAGLIPAFNSGDNILIAEDDIRAIAFSDDELVELARQRLSRRRSPMGARPTGDSNAKSVTAQQSRGDSNEHSTQL